MGITNLDFGTAADGDGELEYTAWPKVQANFEDLDTRATAIVAALAAHEAAADPHPGYLTPAEGNAAYQPLDSDLTAIAALSTTSYGRALLELADAAALRTAGGLVIGTDVQAYDSDLAAWAGVNPSSYSTTAEIAAAYQPIDSDLTAIAALSTTSYGRAFLALADADAGRTALGLGSLATQSGTFSGTSSGTNTGDQTITLTGDVTGSGTGSFAATLATVNSNTGSWGLAASVAQFTVNAKGLITAAANVAISIASTAISDATTAGKAMLTAANAAAQTALLSAFVGDSGSGGTKGLVPAPTAGDATKFLKGDGTFASVPGGGDALTSNPLSQFAATTSAQLRGVLSDETGTGAAVFADTPTLIAPILGTPTSGALTNCTSIPVASATGSFTNTGLKVRDTDASHSLSIVPGSNLTADRTLTITTGDAARTLNLGAWVSYTPTVTAGSGSFTSVSAAGSYCVMGALVFVQIDVTITTNGTAGGSVNATLPFTSASNAVWASREDNSTGNMGQAKVANGATVVNFFTTTNTYPGASGYILKTSGFYQV